MVPSQLLYLDKSLTDMIRNFSMVILNIINWHSRLTITLLPRREVNMTQEADKTQIAQEAYSYKSQKAFFLRL